jgi:oligoribonuclease
MKKKISNSRKDRILWLDLEMSGLSATEDLILEIAAIVTDWNFNEIATYQGIVKNNVATLKRRIETNSSFWDRNPKARDGLIEQNKKGKSLKIIETELIEFVNKNFGKNSQILSAGNSIHVDRRFIMAKWPIFDSRLHYRMLDVSAWKVVFDGKYKKKFAKAGTHRALDDIRGSIMELQYYLAKIK